MNQDTAKVAPPGPERRQRFDLRAIFADAVALVAPYYQTAGVPMEYWAARALREAYPDLDAQGFQMLLAAVSRVCCKRVAKAA